MVGKVKVPLMICTYTGSLSDVGNVNVIYLISQWKLMGALIATKLCDTATKLCDATNREHEKCVLFFA